MTYPSSGSDLRTYPMFGWTTLIIWPIVLGIWLFKKLPGIADFLIGNFVLFPLAFVFVLFNMNFMVRSPGEVFVSLVILGFFASIPVSLFFSWLGIRCKMLKSDQRWTLLVGFLVGSGIGVAHLWVLISRRTSIDSQAEWWMFSIVDGLILALISGASVQSSPNTWRKQIQFQCYVLVAAFLVGGYLLPEVAFRTSGNRDSYSWLEQKGAQRLSKGSGWIAGEANRALARSGDVTKLALLLEDVRSGNPALGVNGSIQILTSKYSDKPEVQEALLKLLADKASVSPRSGSFGENEWMLLELIKAAKQISDEKAVPALVRIYQNNKDNSTLQTETSEALVSIGGNEATELARRELKREPPINPVVAKILMQLPEALDSKITYEDAVDKRETERRMRSAPISELVSNRSNDELYRRATEKDSGDRGLATIGLVKLKDPRREEALLRNAFPAHGWAKELRGFSDPDLAKSINNRILKSKSLDGHLARFLCEWSPPEGRKAAQFLVEKRSYGPAIQHLMRLGDNTSIEVLTKQLVRNPKGPLGLQICGTLASKPTMTVVPALQSAMAVQEVRPRLLFNGKELYLSDVAAVGLMRCPSIPAQNRARSHIFKGSREGAEEYVGYCGKSVER